MNPIAIPKPAVGTTKFRWARAPGCRCFVPVVGMTEAGLEYSVHDFADMTNLQFRNTSGTASMVTTSDGPCIRFTRTNGEGIEDPRDWSDIADGPMTIVIRVFWGLTGDTVSGYIWDGRWSSGGGDYFYIEAYGAVISPSVSLFSPGINQTGAWTDDPVPHTVVFVFDGVKCDMYHDGVLVKTDSAATLHPGSARMWLARMDPKESLQKDISMFAFFDRALTPYEVQEISFNPFEELRTPKVFLMSANGGAAPEPGPGGGEYARPVDPYT